MNYLKLLLNPIVFVVLMTVTSCQQQRCLNLLTDGNVKFWKNKDNPAHILSFNKMTKRTADYYNYSLSPINDYDAVHGTYFLLEGRNIVRYWKGKDRDISIDTLCILSISSKIMKLRKKNAIKSIMFHSDVNAKIMINNQ